MSSNFELKADLQGNCLLLTVAGYLNNTGGQQIIDEFEKHFIKGIHKVVLVFKEVNVVNSIGISYLIEMIDKIQGENGRLVFVNAQPAIEKTFTIMGLYSHALKANSMNEALQLVA